MSTRPGRKKTAAAAVVDIAAAAVAAAGKTNAGRVKSNWGAALATAAPGSLRALARCRFVLLPDLVWSSRAFDDGGSRRIEERKKETAYGHPITYYLPKATERNGAR
jgi:hypothetical protein